MSLERETLVRMDSANPRYMCCGKKVETLSLRVAVIEIVVSILVLIVVLSVAGARARPALPSVAVTVVLYVLIKIAVSACVLWGILRSNHSCLIAYLVFKGLEISMAAIGILVAFLCMVGMTTIQGLLSSALRNSAAPETSTFEPGFANFYDEETIYDDIPLPEGITKAPGDIHKDYEGSFNSGDELQPVSITGMLAGLLVLLCVVIGSGVYFFITVLKTYHMLQDRDYHEYNLGLKSLKPLHSAGDSFVGLQMDADGQWLAQHQDYGLETMGSGYELGQNQNSYRMMVAPSGHVYHLNNGEEGEEEEDYGYETTGTNPSPRPTHEPNATPPPPPPHSSQAPPDAAPPREAENRPAAPPRTRYPTPGQSIQHQIGVAFASMAGRMTRSHHADQYHHEHESSCENLTEAAAAEEDCGSLELELDTAEPTKKTPAGGDAVEAPQKPRSASLKYAGQISGGVSTSKSKVGTTASNVAPATSNGVVAPGSVKVKKRMCDAGTNAMSNFVGPENVDDRDRSSEESAETGNNNSTWTNADVLTVGRYFLSGGGPKFERL